MCFQECGWTLSRGPGWGAFGIRDMVPVLVVFLTRYVISANPPIPTKLLFLHLPMEQYLADCVVLIIKRNDSSEIGNNIYDVQQEQLKREAVGGHCRGAGTQPQAGHVDDMGKTDSWG